MVLSVALCVACVVPAPPRTAFAVESVGTLGRFPESAAVWRKSAAEFSNSLGEFSESAAEFLECAAENAPINKCKFTNCGADGKYCGAKIYFRKQKRPVFRILCSKNPGTVCGERKNVVNLWRNT